MTNPVKKPWSPLRWAGLMVVVLVGAFILAVFIGVIDTWTSNPCADMRDHVPCFATDGHWIGPVELMPTTKGNAP